MMKAEMHKSRRTQGQAGDQRSETNFIVAMELFRWNRINTSCNLEPEGVHLRPFFVCPCMPRWMNTSSVKILYVEDMCQP
jgi:hypothetical protein